MANQVRVWCGVYGEGTVFDVMIAADATVSDLKRAIFEKNRYRERFRFAASSLKLYLAKKDGKWLESDTNLIPFLERGRQDNNEYAQMIPNWKLDKPELLGAFDFEADAEVIHVLVALPEAAAKRSPKRPRLPWQTTHCRVHEYSASIKFFHMHAEAAEISGLLLPSAPRLYCRPDFHRQFEFMRHEVLDEACIGYIVGPPGTGKSAAAFAFALTVDRNEWVVTWIHLWKPNPMQCVRLDGSDCKSRSLYSAEDVEDALTVGNDKKHLVIVDGWTGVDDGLESICVAWLHQDSEPKRKRLTFVCSLAPRRKIAEDTQEQIKARMFYVYSWTLNEYLEAIEDDSVFENVKESLDATGDGSRKDLVEAKHHYAGGSCRYMFSYKTAKVKAYIESAVRTVPNTNDAASIGDQSPNVVNRLFGSFLDPNFGTVKTIVSPFAATSIAIETNPEVIRRFMAIHRYGTTPSLDGGMLEMLFFASLKNGGVTIVDAQGNAIDKWDQSIVVVCDGVPNEILNSAVWIKPDKWYQGGYDAIMVNRNENLVRFVQVTGAHKHSFKIDYFYRWLELLRDSSHSFVVEKLEIFFVVDQSKLNDFKIGDITGEGLLMAFGWPKGGETKKVNIVGIRGLYDLSV